MPFYDRTGSYWIREDKFAEKGFTVAGGHFERWQGVLEAARAVSNPEANFHGWGMTVNRSGDGEAVVWDLVQAFGGALTDATGRGGDPGHPAGGGRGALAGGRLPRSGQPGPHPAGDQRLERHQQ